MSYLWNQGENGVCCPMGMTFASIAALRNDQGMLVSWREKILSHTYDPRPIYAAGKRGATVGMAMTEKQGGSDLRATITTAHPATRAIGLRRGIPPDRPQVVLLGADERSLSYLGAD